MAKVSAEAVRRLSRQLGKDGQRFHDEQVQNMPVTALQADERWGYVGGKVQQCWEAEVIDPKSRLIVAREQGSTDEHLIRRLLEDARSRLTYPQGVVLFSDGELQDPLSKGVRHILPSCPPGAAGALAKLALPDWS